MTIPELVHLGFCYFCKREVFKGSQWDLAQEGGASRLRCGLCNGKVKRP